MKFGFKIALFICVTILFQFIVGCGTAHLRYTPNDSLYLKPKNNFNVEVRVIDNLPSEDKLGPYATLPDTLSTLMSKAIAEDLRASNVFSVVNDANSQGESDFLFLVDVKRFYVEESPGITFPLMFLTAGILNPGYVPMLRKHTNINISIKFIDPETTDILWTDIINEKWKSDLFSGVTVNGAPPYSHWYQTISERLKIQMKESIQSLASKLDQPDSRTWLAQHSSGLQFKDFNSSKKKSATKKTYQPSISSQPPAIITSDKRLALIIGNGAYPASPLKNPVNDANDMADTLNTLGFEVILAIDSDRKSMVQAISKFGDKLPGIDVGLFYYAGHGIQIDGRNYLIPVDAQIRMESEIEFESVDVGRLLAQMENAKSKVNIVMLDACRDNPFARSFRSSNQGLAKMDAPRGSYIAFATSPGALAADGGGRNGIFTECLLANLKIPGLKIEDVMKRTRIGVAQATKNQQLPWDSSSLMGDFYFVPE